MRRPTESELRRGESATWGSQAAPPRPTMKLLNWKPMVRGSLLGFADVELPIGLKIYEIPVLSQGGTVWDAFSARLAELIRAAHPGTFGACGQ
jgi:hypothetical protein